MNALAPDTRPALDLSISNGVYRQGDIEVHMTWLLTTGEPAIVLVPAFRQLSHERVTPCVVPLSSAFKWDEERGSARDADDMAFRFAALLGKSPLERRNVLRIQSIVRDFLNVLVDMPPMPEHFRRKVADLVITDNDTGKVTHKEVRDV